jgi:hypothetical protein
MGGARLLPVATGIFCGIPQENTAIFTLLSPIANPSQQGLLFMATHGTAFPRARQYDKASS